MVLSVSVSEDNFKKSIRLVIRRSFSTAVHLAKSDALSNITIVSLQS
jgi:hypothetical protein